MYLKYFALKELWELFRSIDSDGSGVLTMPEVVLFLKSITDDISTENIEKIFDGLDDSGDRSIDFEEFKVIEKIPGVPRVLFE